MIPAVLVARCHFVGAARSSVSYCREHGIDWSSIEPATGGLFLANIVPDPPGRFRFDPRGIEAAVVEAIGEDCESVEDIVAWPVGDPELVLTACGIATVLGEAHAANPATFALGQPLRLFRTPLAWLQAGCQGAVVLDYQRGARWLRDLDGPIAAEDEAHAAHIREAIIATLRLTRIMVPRRRRVAA